MQLLHQFAVITRYEIDDALRSRRAVNLLLIYLLCSIAACIMFVHILHSIETELVQAIGLQPREETGGATRTLWKSESFRRMLTRLVGVRDLASELLSTPPLAIFFGWVALTFTPLLVILVSSPRIAEEVGTSSVRFVLFRTTRGTWVCGKFAGQALLLFFYSYKCSFFIFYS